MLHVVQQFPKGKTALAGPSAWISQNLFLWHHIYVSGCILKSKKQEILFSHTVEISNLAEGSKAQIKRRFCHSIAMLMVHLFYFIFTDFGLSNCASILGYSDPFSTQCGSPAYAAPELLARKKYGPKIDVWSMWVTSIEKAARFLSPPF